MITIDQWTQHAVATLAKNDIPSSRLDAEIILAHTLRKSRTYLHAHGDDPLTDRQYEIADARLQLRVERTPIAYIIGHKEFYGRTFKVTPAVLVPRPESEVMITFLKERAVAHAIHEIVDVGTGSGCLGITAKLELPTAHVTLIDTSQHALKVAETNAAQLRADVTINRSSLLHNYPLNADAILANLPYVNPEWERSPETAYEPKEALFADHNGLQLIEELILQAPSHLSPDGSLFIEAARIQHNTIIQRSKAQGLQHVQTQGLIIHLQKQ